MRIDGIHGFQKGLFSLIGVLAIGIAGLSASSPPARSSGKPANENEYVGAKKCKLCHHKEANGDQFAKWEEMRHSKAWETLASDKAKQIAKEKGIEDPQKSDQCVKCHMTAFGVSDEMKDKRFDPKMGVQCESCHGPGGNHVKARLAAAKNIPKEDRDKVQQVGEGEILHRPSPDACLGCHNTESPSFKSFCFRKKLEKIRHWDPRRERSAEEIEALKCPCPDCNGEKACDNEACMHWPEK